MDEKTALLEQLEDINLPGNAGFPIAPGWIVLLVLCVLGLWLAYTLWRRHKNKPPPPPDWQTPARVELRQLQERVRNGQSNGVLADCSRLARRISLAIESRQAVAPLTGDAWLAKLDELSHSHFFTQGLGQQLAHAPYQKNIETPAVELETILDALNKLVDQPGVVRK